MNVGRGVNWGVVRTATAIEVVLVTVAMYAGASLGAGGSSNPFVVVGLVGLITGGLLAGRLADRRTTVAVRHGIFTGVGSGTLLYAMFVCYLAVATGELLALSEIFGAGLVVVNIFVIVNIALAIVGNWLRIKYGRVGSYGMLQ